MTEFDPTERIAQLERKVDRLRRNVIATEERIAWYERELGDLKRVRDVETCALCDNSGEQRIEGYDADNPPDYIPCKACHGEGKISSAQERDAFDGIVDDMAARDNALPYDEPRRRGAERMYR